MPTDPNTPFFTGLLLGLFIGFFLGVFIMWTHENRRRQRASKARRTDRERRRLFGRWF